MAPAPRDQSEPNDSFEQARDLGTGDRSLADMTVHAPGNDDWYRWTAGADGTLVIDLDFAHAGGDLNLELYDASHTLVDASTSTTDNEQVSVAAATGARTLSACSGRLARLQDSYDLTIDANDPPTLSDLENRSTDEDVKLPTIDLTVGDDETAANFLQLSATSSDTVLVPNSNIAFAGTGANRTMAVVPVANRSGQTTITVQVSDGQGGITRRSFALVVRPVADQPNLTTTNATGEEDTEIPLAIDASLVDVDGSESLAVRIGGLPGGAVLSKGQANADGSWTLTVADLAGLTVTPSHNSDVDMPLTVVATSSESANGNQATRTADLLVTVQAAADTPALAVADAAGQEGTAANLEINAALTDLDGSEVLSLEIAGVPAGATLSAGTNNGGGRWTVPPSALPSLKINLPSDSDGDFTLNVTATATESANGDQAVSVGTIAVTVVPTNDLPTISNVPNTATDEDVPTPAIPLTIGDAETPAAQLRLGATSSNLTLVPNANIVLGGSGANRQVTVTPAANRNGTSTITITVTDAFGGVASDSFVLTVRSVNDAPTVVAPIGSLAVNEDAPNATFNLATVFSDADAATGDGVLTFTLASNSNPGLVAATVSGSTLTLDYLENQNGAATVVVQATDQAGALRGIRSPSRWLP